MNTFLKIATLIVVSLIGLAICVIIIEETDHNYIPGLAFGILILSTLMFKNSKKGTIKGSYEEDRIEIDSQSNMDILEQNKIQSKKVSSSEPNFESSISSNARKTELLKESFELKLISEFEFHDKINKLVNEKKIIESKLEEIKENNKEEELKKIIEESIKESKEKLSELKKEGLLTELEFNKKVEILYNEKNIYLKNKATDSNSNISNDDINPILIVITIVIAAIIILTLVIANSAQK